tara:strand:+ start:377 stop:787 length:411 start_codon:yes stop_codon:yes gene_type:complete
MVSVLLIEDDDVEAERVCRALSKAEVPFPVRRASDGLEALDILRGTTPPPMAEPFIILLDLKLPRMSGLEFLKELRGNPKLKHIVVFVLTTSSNEADRREAYEFQIAGYLLKSGLDANFDNSTRMLSHYCSIVTFR